MLVVRIRWRKRTYTHSGQCADEFYWRRRLIQFCGEMRHETQSNGTSTMKLFSFFNVHKLKGSTQIWCQIGKNSPKALKLARALPSKTNMKMKEEPCNRIRCADALDERITCVRVKCWNFCTAMQWISATNIHVGVLWGKKLNIVERRDVVKTVHTARVATCVSICRLWLDDEIHGSQLPVVANFDSQTLVNEIHLCTLIDAWVPPTFHQSIKYREREE